MDTLKKGYLNQGQNNEEKREGNRKSEEYVEVQGEVKKCGVTEQLNHEKNVWSVFDEGKSRLSFSLAVRTLTLS